MTDSLTVRDNRTGQEYEVPITDGTIRANDLRQIKADDDDFGLAEWFFLREGADEFIPYPLPEEGEPAPEQTVLG